MNELSKWRKRLQTIGVAFLQKQGGICGPWIPDDGKIVTHTVSKAGMMTQKYWTSKVSQPKQKSSKGRLICSMCQGWGRKDTNIKIKVSSTIKTLHQLQFLG